MIRKSPIVRLATFRQHRLRLRREKIDAEAQILTLGSLSHVASSLAHDFKDDIGTIWNSVDVLESEPGAAGRDDVNDAGDATNPSSAGRTTEKSICSVAQHASTLAANRKTLDVRERACSPGRPRSVIHSNRSTRRNTARAASRIIADPDQQFVLESLLANSRDTLDEHRQERSVRINVHSTEHEALLSLRDNGRGMNPVTRERCFEPFFTTRATRSGLGLFVAQTFMRRHGGRIAVESCDGEGTCLTLALPRPVTAEIA